MWRLWTRLEEFPRGFGHCELALEAKVFEASHTYTLKGMDQFLTVIEEDGRRYYKAYRADRLDGKWIPITALPDQLVVNVGDMLERLTNKKLKSTIHRVVNPPREKMNTSRYSIPFFMHPRSEMDLSCLSGCVSEGNPKQFTDINAGGFLEERLRELGLRK